MAIRPLTRQRLSERHQVKSCWRCSSAARLSIAAGFVPLRTPQAAHAWLPRREYIALASA